ncbi:ABC transporter B family member 26, chloroplastic [Apostasia shenzhenica]|uniref:ABC transporter B family member 26, chloroplastic n=1 Tax=Apostasia shenzhenica TaxID=1088818 RepID=A0A2I0AQD2_9ASPA|nr:ABC transporter B family member 26, chloroplastic [Apostasia shenzhenica]
MPAAAAAAALLTAAPVPLANTAGRISYKCNRSLHRQNPTLFPEIRSRTLFFPSTHLVELLQHRHRNIVSPLTAAASNSFLPVGGSKAGDSGVAGLLERLRAWGHFLPGGRWWVFQGCDGVNRDEEQWKKGVPVLCALRQMWFLVARDRWVIYVAFASLATASVSRVSSWWGHGQREGERDERREKELAELSIPHFLTASIFSAQSGKSSIFYKNARILVSLCLASGICRFPHEGDNELYCILQVKRMREMLYSTLLFQDIAFFDEETVGNLTSRLGSDCQQVSRIIGNDLNLISRNVLQGAGALIYLFILSRPLALSMVLICATLSTVMFFYGRFQKRVAKLMQEFTAHANEVAQETFCLIRTVRVYGTEKQELERKFGLLSPISFHLRSHLSGFLTVPTLAVNRYMKWLERLWDVSLRQSVAYGFWSLSYNFFYHSTQVVAVLTGGISILFGHITAEQLTKFILYAEWLIYSAWWVGDNCSSLMQSIGASEKVFQLMDLLPRQQLISEGKCVLLSKGIRLPKIVGNIEFVDVSFCYPTRSMVPSLKHVNFSVLPNEVTAIVGRSGSGKSTILNLFLRLYEPSNGQILLDGIPLGDLDIKWLRENIGFVGQEPPIFRMDVTSNIRYGCTRETTQEEVEWAAKQALAHEFILSLPNGYSTLVDNALLSGGQKQRIAIARAILREPAILILDEATSALDAESEHYVKELLLSVGNLSGQKRTVIVIAHRLSTIQAADRIVVMDGGTVAEVGNHKELLQNGGFYTRLVGRHSDALA